jgi:uncharacterized protein (TIGR00159 family)
MLNLFIQIKWIDVVDILLFAILIFQIYKLIRGTVAINIFLGILSIYVIGLIVENLGMELMGNILDQFIGVGVLALIIVFQQEIRRFLLVVGSGSSNRATGLKRLLPWNWKNANFDSSKTDILPIVKACHKMSNSKTGALIIITRTSELVIYQKSGVAINADVSDRLIESIFYKNSPLHDGAVIIVNNKIKAAQCILPVSENKIISDNLGLRHRAAIGITEQSDAIAITVSEQTGAIALAVKGNLKTDLNQQELMESLKRELA